MGQPCTICSHSRSGAIDTALKRGDPISSISKRFEVSRPALYRHLQVHLRAGARAPEPRTVAPPLEADTAATAPGPMPEPAPANPAPAPSVQNIIKGLLGNANRIAQSARASGDRRTELAATSLMSKLVEQAAENGGFAGSGDAGPAAGGADGGAVLILPANGRDADLALADLARRVRRLPAAPDRDRIAAELDRLAGEALADLQRGAPAADEPDRDPANDDPPY